MLSSLLSSSEPRMNANLDTEDSRPLAFIRGSFAAPRDCSAQTKKAPLSIATDASRVKPILKGRMLFHSRRSCGHQAMIEARATEMQATPATTKRRTELSRRWRILDCSRVSIWSRRLSLIHETNETLICIEMAEEFIRMLSKRGGGLHPAVAPAWPGNMF